MNNKMLELAKELKADALLTRRYQIAKCSVWSDQLIKLCEHVERISQTNEDSAKLIESFCADDTEWHKLLDASEQENSTLISLVIKLADKCNKMQKEIEKPQTYAVGWNGKLVKSDTGEIVNLYDVMEILNKHGVKIKDE